jgi:hypothetical protein
LFFSFLTPCFSLPILPPGQTKALYKFTSTTLKIN